MSKPLDGWKLGEEVSRLLLVSVSANPRIIRTGSISRDLLKDWFTNSYEFNFSRYVLCNM